MSHSSAKPPSSKTTSETCPESRARHTTAEIMAAVARQSRPATPETIETRLADEARTAADLHREHGRHDL